MGRADVLKGDPDLWRRRCAQVINDLNADSGIYTPTLTYISNVSAATASPTHYVQFLDRVLVFGYIGIDPTATGAVQLAMSLPIASNFAAFSDLAGVLMSDSFAEGGSITADTTNDRALIVYNATNAGNSGFGFFYGYRVI